jgi:hypothetical protein
VFLVELPEVGVGRFHCRVQRADLPLEDASGRWDRLSHSSSVRFPGSLECRHLLATQLLDAFVGLFLGSHLIDGEIPKAPDLQPPRSGMSARTGRTVVTWGCRHPMALARSRTDIGTVLLGHLAGPQVLKARSAIHVAIVATSSRRMGSSLGTHRRSVKS